MSRGFLPRQDVQFTGPTGRPTTPFYTWLQGLDAALKGGSSVAEIQAEIDRLRQAIADIPTTGFLPNTTNVFGQNSVITFGTLAGGVVLVELTGDVANPYPFQFYGVGSDRVRGWRWIYDALEAGTGLVQTMDGFNVVGVLGSVEDLPVSGTVGDAYLVAGHLWAWDGSAWADEGDASGVTMFALAPLPDSGEGALLAITRDQYGRVEGTKPATITGTAGQIDVANGDAVAGLPTISLADVADAGGGTLQRTAFDAKGRKTGTSAATTDDLAEGSANLYFTNARADARITAAKADPDGIASLLNGKLDPGQLPALAITETFVVNTEAAMLALDAQQGDVAVRSDEQKSYILTADPASTLSNWQELLVPTGVGVASFNGRTGSVVPASGDYTAAMVGAATAAQGALADSAIQPGNPALSDAREWTASTVSQAEAEAGTATTRRAWTAQRVRQAIAAWWAGSPDKAKLDLMQGGTYTPTATGVANVTSATPFPCSWIRSGNSVLVSGRVDAVNAAATTFTQVRITIPFPSNFTSGGDASGSATYNQGATNLGAGFAAADVPNDQIILSYIPIAAATNAGIRFTVVYPILP